jgi:protein-tyrosine-phosphatase
VVVTVCDRVREVCPAFPAETRTVHWSVPDPAAAIGSEADRLAAFRATADEIARRVRFLAGELGAAAPTVGS